MVEWEHPAFFLLTDEDCKRLDSTKPACSISLLRNECIECINDSHCPSGKICYNTKCEY